MDAIVRGLESRGGNIPTTANAGNMHWDFAVHGAVASNRRQALERLLEKKEVDVNNQGANGWTPLYTAHMYDFSSMEQTLLDRWSGFTSPLIEHPLVPSGWHPDDKLPCLVLGPKRNNLTVHNILIEGTKFIANDEEPCGVARANYLMLPLVNKSVFYFEVKITNAGENNAFAVGFCDDRAPLNRMLGFDHGSWGFHGTHGRLFDDGWRPWEGKKYDGRCDWVRGELWREDCFLH
ncbi:hypothetical protein B0O99DRAFT_556011 [Bisporella sp. PMI_857]|nr:hypothetical protein B0O99DRAFT_556011 [Bisporella sp. PMI_857]